MRAIFSIIVMVIFGAWSVFCMFFAFLMCILLISKKPTIFFAKYLWAPVAIFIFGSRLKVIGIEKINQHTPYVVMSNHCSYLDIPALFHGLPIYLHFIAKKELKRMPFLGWFMILSGMIFIDRKNNAEAKLSLKKAAELINEGQHVVIFPEGTASKNGSIQQFKKGGFHLAHDAKATIVPIRIKGTFKVWPSSNKLGVSPGKIELIIGEPIAPEILDKMELDERILFVKNQIENL